jgi:hypothetical protein
MDEQGSKDNLSYKGFEKFRNHLIECTIISSPDAAKKGISFD